jgi:hypothetical protein
MLYNTKNYWVFGLRPLSGILEARKYDPFPSSREVGIHLLLQLYTPETRLTRREITGMYALNIAINQAQTRNFYKNEGENLCYKSSQQTKSTETNAF